MRWIQTNAYCSHWWAMGINLLSRNHAHLPENTYADLWQSIQQSCQLMPSCSGLETTHRQFSAQFGVFKPKKNFHLNPGITIYFSNSWPLLWGWVSRKNQCTAWSETRTLLCEIVLAHISTRTYPTVHMAFKTARANTNYTLHNPANQVCYELLACSNANDASVCAPLFAGQAARHKSIKTGWANRMDLGGVLSLEEALEAQLVNMTFEIRMQVNMTFEIRMQAWLVICCCESSADENAGSCRVKSNCHVIGSTT